MTLTFSHDFNLLAILRQYFVHVDDSVPQKVRFYYIIFFSGEFSLSLKNFFWIILSCINQTCSDLNIIDIVSGILY